jgi:8-oxo-dGTP diphosphatase
VILTNMCMVYNNDGTFLVEDRAKLDWPGLTFPGGHVKANETMEQSVVREIKEETGLDISKLEEVGVYEWNEPKQGVRHVAALYRTNVYKGTLTASKEGKVFWIRPEEVKNYKLSTDMDKLLSIMRRGI